MIAHIALHLRHHGRFYAAALAGIAVGAAVPALPQALRLLVAGDVFFAAYLLSTGTMMLRFTPAAMRRRAEYADEGVVVIVLLTVTAIVLSLGAIFAVLAEPVSAPPLHLAAMLLAVPLGWATLHTVAALRYAHLFYEAAPATAGTPRADAGGLGFPGDGEPAMWDFLYFAFVVGMTAQVSDVQVLDTRLRRLALLHGVAAFFFNTVILALAVNIAAGLGR